MRVIDYLKAKYGNGQPTTILYAEAKAFGIKYPLQKGWSWTHGNKEINPDMANKCRALLTKMVKENHVRAESAKRGLQVLDDAYLFLKSIPDAKSPDFLSSKSWLRLRIEAFKKLGNKCQLCGSGPENGARLNVDHIKPRRLFPELALDIENLQILCSQCNEGKGNWDFTSWKKDSNDV